MIIKTCAIDIHHHYVPESLLEEAKKRGAHLGVTLAEKDGNRCGLGNSKAASREGENQAEATRLGKCEIAIGASRSVVASIAVGHSAGGDARKTVQSVLFPVVQPVFWPGRSHCCSSI